MINTHTHTVIIITLLNAFSRAEVFFAGKQSIGHESLTSSLTVEQILKHYVTAGEQTPNYNVSFMSSLFTCKNIFSLFKISHYFIAQQKDTNRMTTNKTSIFKTTQITSTVNLKLTQLGKSCFLTCRQTHT